MNRNTQNYPARLRTKWLALSLIGIVIICAVVVHWVHLLPVGRDSRGSRFHSSGRLLPSTKEMDGERTIDSGFAQISSHDSRTLEKHELEEALIQAKCFIGILLSTNALEATGIRGRHSFDVQLVKPATSAAMRYPLEAKATIKYEPLQNAIIYYNLMRAASNGCWAVEDGWTIENGETNALQALPSREIQEWACMHASIAASVFMEATEPPP